jgi:hypothetical protein
MREPGRKKGRNPVFLILWSAASLTLRAVIAGLCKPQYRPSHVMGLHISRASSIELFPETNQDERFEKVKKTFSGV